MKRIFSLWLLGMMFIIGQVYGQGRTVSGTVTDATTGDPLIGVNVMVKGTTTGTASDMDGNYSIQVPDANAVLEFSYVGYVTIERQANSNVINISLSEDAEMLDEVVVTALGVTKAEKAITYNSQVVKGDDMNKARENNIVNSLAGKIAGAQITNSSGAPGASTRIVLRGASSLTGNNQPLFVVDGVPIDNTNWGDATASGGVDLPNGISSINADDIENVTVLAGAKAAALYGVRASNGVILITTKKGGFTNSSKSQIGVEMNTSLTFETPFRLPSFQNSYGQGPNNTFFDWDQGNGDGSVDESWGPPLDKGLEFIQWNSYTNGGKPMPWVSQPNNIRDLYELGLTWNNSVALTGASDKSTFRLSFGNLNQKGMVYNTDYNRYTVGLNSTYKLTDKLVPGFSLNYVKEKSENLPQMGYASENFVQQTIWSGRNVDFNALKDWRNLPLAPEGSAAAGTPINWNVLYQNNPFWVLDNNLNGFDKDRIIGNANITYNINDHFMLKAMTGTDFYSLNTTTQKAVGSNENIDGYYSEAQRRFYEMNSSLLATYNQNFLDNRLGVSLATSGNLMQQRYNALIGTANALEVPGVYNLSNIKSGSSPVVESRIEKNNLNTIRGTAEFSWDSWIYVDGSVTNDWSSRLPVENNSFLSYSVGASFVPSKFLKKQDKLSFVKINGAYSSVGGFGALVPYRTSQTYDIRQDIPFTTLLMSDPASLNNPNLKPERTNEWEIGGEIKLFNGRIGVKGTYYNKTSKDLLLQVQTSAASGYSTAWKNAGTMTNKGVTLNADFSLLDKKDYKINVNLNWAKNKNEVTSVGEGQESLLLGTNWDMTLEAKVGESYASLVGRSFERDDNGNIIYLNGLPVINQTRKTLGTTQPKWNGGVGLSVYIKGLTISTLFDAKIGGNVHSMTYTWGRYAGTLEETLLGRETGIVGNGVKNVGTDDQPVYVTNDIVVPAKTYNQFVYGNNNSENGIFDASYIKWRQLIASYDLPSKLFEKSKINTVSIGLVARNLMLLYSRVPHIDPETAFSSANGGQGQEFGQLPTARSIGVNFNIKF